MITLNWATEAQPQSRTAVSLTPKYPRIVKEARARGITRVVHFTRIKGLVGILASGAVKARSDLPSDAHVKHVYEPNASNRSLDRQWHDYINLSVSAINPEMFKPSQRWHPTDQWVILEFGPKILGRRGVVFCTTNNIYPSVRRARGLQGFKQMFAEEVPGRYSKTIIRGAKPLHMTTDPQAEVLYPFELPLKHLHKITTSDEDSHDAAVAAVANFPYEPMIEQDPEAFR